MRSSLKGFPIALSHSYTIRGLCPSKYLKDRILERAPNKSPFIIPSSPTFIKNHKNFVVLCRRMRGCMFNMMLLLSQPSAAGVTVLSDWSI